MATKERKDGRSPRSTSGSTSSDGLTLEQRKTKARTATDRRLREEYQGRWNEIHQEECQALGIEWKPKPTQQEKDLFELRGLIARYPTQAYVLAKAEVSPDTAGLDDAVVAGPTGDPSL